MNRTSGVFLVTLFFFLLVVTFSVREVGAEPSTGGWTKTYGGTSYDFALSVVQTSDGGYALAGRTQSYGAGMDDFWLVKTDVDGNALWNQTYGGANWDYPYSVVQTDDGGYVLAGFTFSYGAGYGDFWLVKTDASGNAQWNKTYGGTGSDFGQSVVLAADGGYAITGTTQSYGAGHDDFWLVKTDADGNMQWNKTYGGGGDDYAYSVVRTSDGGYAMAGWTGPYATDLRDCWMVRTDVDGNALWNQTYGGLGIDSAYSVIQTGDGGYVLAGSTASYGAGETDFWLVKTDESGIIPEFSPFIVIPLFIATTMSAIIAYRKKRSASIGR